MELGLIGRFIRNFSKKKSQTFSVSGTFPLYFSQEKNGDELRITIFGLSRGTRRKRKKFKLYIYKQLERKFTKISACY